MTITLVDFATITGLLFGRRSVVFDNRLQSLSCVRLQASLRAIIGIEPTDLDMTWHHNLGVATLSYLYYGMDLCLRGNHLKIGYPRVIKVLPMPRLISFSASVDETTLPRGQAWRYGKKYAHTTSDPSVFHQMLNSLDCTTASLFTEIRRLASFLLVVMPYQQRRLLLPGLFYDMFYLGERVYEWELSTTQRRLPHGVPYFMMVTWEIKGEMTATARRGTTATEHLADFVPAIFSRTQILVRVHPSTNDEPAPKVEEVVAGDQGAAPSRQQCSKHVRRGSTFTFLSASKGLPVQGMQEMHTMSPYRMFPSGCTHMFLKDYNEVSQLFKATRLKLVVARLYDEHISTLAPMDKALFSSFTRRDWDTLSPFELNRWSYYRNIRVQPGLLQWLINHFDYLDTLFRHNDFKICPLFKEFSIIFGRILVIEEIPVVPRLNIDPSSLILPVFGFSAYEIPTYELGDDVVTLRPLERALEMDCANPY
ncbi:hypothetical protein JCGZ_23720 [Jatropha curcas]|uniref:Aminotransferase-like plant mobile domain-containing protein n=1 Tax=Jatropha curcas TaxID=180498 RepID=A0A067K262_JATCU|nr:hypothetical protein JCGZ_23720 [Jatropha curcas]